MDASTFRASAQAAIAASRQALDHLLALPESIDYATTVAAVDAILRPLNGVEGRAQLFGKVHPDDELRECALSAEQELAAWNTELSLHRELFERLVRLENETAPGPEEARLTELCLQSLRRAGVDRDEETRARVTSLKEEIVKIGQAFDQNIITGGRDFVIAEGAAGLAGLPQDFIASHPEAEDGSVTLTTDPQDRQPFLTFAESGELRKRYYHACMNRAAPENLGALDELLAKRHELATLLGYASWADYITEDKMAKSGADAKQFIERVIESSRARSEREFGELLAEKQRSEPEASQVFSWERGYLGEKVRQRKYDFDSQSVRPYFPYAGVRQGVLDTSAALYGVEFRRNTEEATWHPSVECYDVLDGGETVARFFLDMHPRDNKYKHAAMFDLTAGVLGECLPEAALVCNFPEPKNGDAGLMLRGEVKTFFHEFGHLLHHLFSRQRYVRLAGISCEWDFVEVPSQLYEEWTWDYDVLSSFARHHETGEPIPVDLVERMRRAEEYGKGLLTLTQMYFAMLSLTLYDRDPSEIDTLGHMIALGEEILPFPYEKDTYFIASFGHLNGYSAMYYTYMWSLVIAKDLFSRFEGRVMDTGVAREYREKITSRGGAVEAATMVRDFLGRDYGFDAFESWLNNQ